MEQEGGAHPGFHISVIPGSFMGSGPGNFNPSPGLPTWRHGPENLKHIHQPIRTLQYLHRPLGRGTS